MNKDDSMFMQGPIPGMSLTGQPRAVPWENPPMMSTVEDTIAYYVDKLLDPETEDNILEVLENKLDIETIADHLITSSVMNGMHSLDVGFLVNPIVRELIMLVADSADTEYIVSYKQQEKDKRVPRRVAREIVNRIMEEQQPTEAAPQAAMEEPQNIPAEYRGLMAPLAR
jgi:hypothetical protein